MITHPERLERGLAEGRQVDTVLLMHTHLDPDIPGNPLPRTPPSAGSGRVRVGGVQDPGAAEVTGNATGR